MKKQKGITLIALVVTIIVLLILAGVSINLLAGGDGIMSKAQETLITNNDAEAKERVNFKIAEFKTDYYRAVYVEKEVSVNVKLGDWIVEVHGDEIIKAGDYEFKITDDGGEYTVTILKNNRIRDNIVGKMSADGQIEWQKGNSSSDTQTETVVNPKLSVVQKVLSYQDEFYEEMFVDKTTTVYTEFGDWMAENYGNEEIDAGDYVFEISGESAPYAITVSKDNNESLSSIETKNFRMTKNASKNFGANEAGNSDATQNASETIEGQMSESGKVTWNEVGTTEQDVNANVQGIVAQANADYKFEYYKAVYYDQTVSENVDFGDYMAENYGGQELAADDYVYQISGESAPYTVTINKTGDLSKALSGQMNSDGNIIWNTIDSGDTEEPGTWEPEPDKKYTITYNANGGTGNVPASAEYEEGTIVTVDFSIVPSHEQGTFAGWATSENAREAIYTKTGTAQLTMPSKDITLYAVYSYSQAYNSQHPELHIPTGFQYKTGTVETGYVITDAENPSDDNGNEFVWIPVASSSVYVKKRGSDLNSCMTSSGLGDRTTKLSEQVKGDTLGVSKILDKQVSATLNANQPEKEVVNSAGGFWVGRYEAGVLSEEHDKIYASTSYTASCSETLNKYWDEKIVEVKQNYEPVRQITQVKALEIANNWKRGEAGDGTVAFQSGLITGTQWDVICNFIGWELCDNFSYNDWGNLSNIAGAPYSGYHSTSGQSDWVIGEDETKLGDGTNKWVFPTGKFVTENNVTTDKKNIFDISGNVSEWTTEIPYYGNGDNSVIRAGSAVDPLIPMYRYGNWSSTLNTCSDIGFRIVLYVK